jgi:hypothetical protein
MALIYLGWNIMVNANDDLKMQLKDMVVACFKLLISIRMETMRKTTKLHSQHSARISQKHKSAVGFIFRVSGFPFSIWINPLPLIS